MPVGRPPGSQNRRTMRAGRILNALAGEHTVEALNAILSIARGDIEAANAYRSGQRPGHDAAARRRQRERRRIAREQPVEASEQQPKPEERPSADAASQRRQRAKRKGKQPREKIEQIPWHVRLAAWRHLLDRSHGKPFPSVPPKRNITIDADAVRPEAERDNQDIRRQRTRGRT